MLMRPCQSYVTTQFVLVEYEELCARHELSEFGPKRSVMQRLDWQSDSVTRVKRCLRKRTRKKIASKIWPFLPNCTDLQCNLLTARPNFSTRDWKRYSKRYFGKGEDILSKGEDSRNSKERREGRKGEKEGILRKGF